MLPHSRFIPLNNAQQNGRIYSWTTPLRKQFPFWRSRSSSIVGGRYWFHVSSTAITGRKGGSLRKISHFPNRKSNLPQGEDSTYSRYLTRSLLKPPDPKKYTKDLNHENYTVGLICALPTELAAIRLALDEEHLRPRQSLDGNNIYTFGSMAGHNVVLACLPAGQYGNNSAATAATQMRLNFKSIRFALLVGIGGGVPSVEADIRLGDVVVSQPKAQHGGVVQYDMGKMYDQVTFERTGYLQPPPTVLLNAISKVQSNHLMGFRQYEHFLSTICRASYFARSHAGPDVLFESTAEHTGPIGCSHCLEIYNTVRRNARTVNHASVHYGTIASANRVIKDGIIRDKISFDLGDVLCFEMEAAGLMNIFPCLIIRGISDYADSHKNERWQPFAAAAAAAYAKELLSVIPQAEVSATNTVLQPTRDTHYKKQKFIRSSFMWNRPKFDR